MKIRTATFAYDIIENTHNHIMIVDRCVKYGCMSITNVAEAVIEDLRKRHLLDDDKRVYYEDSMGKVDELCHDGDWFTGFGLLPD